MTATTEAETFTSMEVVDAAGLTYRQIDYAVKRGFLNPGRRHDRTGTGFARIWPRGELDVACRMGLLVGAGVALEVAAVVARSGEARTEAVLAALRPGPSLSEACARGDCETCWPDEPGSCGCGHHGDEGGGVNG
jgi:hypothetical protein